MKSETFSFSGAIGRGAFLRRGTPVPLLAAAAFLALISVRTGWCQPPPQDHSHRRQYQRQIDEIEQQWRQAQLHGDAAAIDHLLADDYIGITSNGLLQTKEQTLARLRSGQVVLKRMELTEVKVSVHGETAVVTSRAEVETTQNGVERDGIYRYTRVYQHRGGVWKIVNFEATRINPLAQMAIPETTGSASTPADAKSPAPAQTQSH
jgi:ketosteroid isomerase-like protein